MRDSWDGNCSVEWDRLKQKGCSGVAPFSCSFRADAEGRWVTERLISCSWQMLAGVVVSRALKSRSWRLHGMRYSVGGSTLFALDSRRMCCSSLSRCLALDTSPTQLWPVSNCSVSWDTVSVGSLCCGLIQGNVFCWSLIQVWDGFVLSFCGHLDTWAFILSWFCSWVLGMVFSGRPLISPAKGCIPASAVFHLFVHFLCLHTDYRNNFCLLYNIPWVPEMQAIVFVKEKKSCSLVFRVKYSSVRCGNCLNNSQVSEMLNWEMNVMCQDTWGEGGLYSRPLSSLTCSECPTSFQLLFKNAHLLKCPHLLWFQWQQFPGVSWSSMKNISPSACQFGDCFSCTCQLHEAMLLWWSFCSSCWVGYFCI